MAPLLAPLPLKARVAQGEPCPRDARRAAGHCRAPAPHGEHRGVETRAGRGRGHSTARTTAPLTPARHRHPPLAVTVTSGAEPQAAFNCHYYYHRFQRLLPSLRCGDARNFPQMLIALIWDGQGDPHVPATETCRLLCGKEEPTCSPARSEVRGDLGPCHSRDYCLRSPRCQRSNACYSGAGFHSPSPRNDSSFPSKAAPKRGLLWPRIPQGQKDLGDTKE